MQPGLRRAERNAEGFRRLRQGNPEEVMDDDDRAPVRAEAPERTIEQVTVGDEGGGIRDPCRIERLELDLDDPASATAEDVEAGMDSESVEPGIEPVGIAQSRQVPPGSDERLL